MREVFTRQGGKVLRVTTHRCRVDGAHRDGSVPDDFSSCKFYAAEQLRRTSTSSLLFVTLGDDIYQQTLGVPIGFSHARLCLPSSCSHSLSSLLCAS